MAFHVPEGCRDTRHPIMKSTRADGNNGAFYIDSTEPGWGLAMICSDGEGWEHVSVHAYRKRGQRYEGQFRTPKWDEMCFVKRLCWDDEDEVVQYHPKRSEYVNVHPHVLHLWRPIGQDILTPPAHLVGPRMAAPGG